MKSIVAYPDELINDSIIEKYYSNLKMEPDQFLKNILNLNRCFMNNKISQFKEPIVDRNDWADTGNYIAVANAFYLPQLNTIGNKSSFKVNSLK